jgi:hypothetical protein
MSGDRTGDPCDSYPCLHSRVQLSLATHGVTPGSTVFRRAHFPAPVEIRPNPRVGLLVTGESPQYRMRRVWGCGGLESDKSLDGKASMFVGDELCQT